jgi:hypothetical protein
MEAAKIEGKPKDIDTAIDSVYKKIGYVHKGGNVDGGGMKYSFAKESDFIAALRPEMILAGISQHAQEMLVISNDRIETIRRSNDGKEYSSYQFRVCVKAVYRFTHGESKTYRDVEAFGEGMDTGDKSFNKAMTGANKYALRQTFMVETGDDPDKYGSHPDGGIETGEPIKNNNVNKPKAPPKETTAPKDSKPKADDKPEPPKKLSVDTINEFSAKLPTIAIDQCEKAETWINAQGIANKIDRVIWGDLQYKLLLRWIELAPEAVTLAVIANKIPPLAGMGLFTVEQRADLTNRLKASE